MGQISVFLLGGLSYAGTQLFLALYLVPEKGTRTSSGLLFWEPDFMWRFRGYSCSDAIRFSKSHVVSNDIPIFGDRGRGDGISQGRAHARGARTPQELCANCITA